MTAFVRRHIREFRNRAWDLLEKPYSGTVVATAIGLTVAVLLTAGFILDLGWVASWKVIGFPGALPPFYDLHAVTSKAGACAAAGNVYPYVSAPCNPWPKFNYPPIWLLLGKLGINETHTVLLASLIEVPALVMLAINVRGRSVRAGFISLLMIFSPSSILAFERGNIDIAIWVLVCAAALIFHEQHRLRAVLSLMLLGFGVVLKFLSVFCCVLFIRFRSAAMLTSILLVVFTAVYVSTLWDVLPLIRHYTPLTPYISYGYPIIFDRLEFVYAPYLGLNLTGLTNSPIPIISVSLFIIGSMGYGLRTWRGDCELGRVPDGTTGTSFLFGAGVFCGSFLLGTNYTYRLIFLLLCLPQMLDWIETRRTSARRSRRLGWVLFASCVISMWLKFHPEKSLHINQITDWIVLGTMTMVLTVNALNGLSEAAPSLAAHLQAEKHRPASAPTLADNGP